MTESEAIRFQEAFYMMVNSEREKEACKTAISALKEVGEYQEVDVQIKKIFDGQLGLVDIVKEYIEDIRRTHNGKMPRKVIALSEEDAKNWEDYKEIGTVEECREAVERQKLMRVNEVHVDEYFCPACGSENNCDYGKVHDKYCPMCGHAIYQEESEEE